MSNKRTIGDDLLRAIAKAERKGQTRYAIAKAGGLALPVLVRIANGTTIPRLDTAAKIANAIGYTLTLVTK